MNTRSSLESTRSMINIESWMSCSLSDKTDNTNLMIKIELKYWCTKTKILN